MKSPRMGAAAAVSTGMPPRLRIIAFEVTLDDRRYGERFDLLMGIENEP